MSWFGIDPTEVASNSVVGLAIAACSWVGSRIGGLIQKVHKAEKDLNALWPRFRELEERLRGHHAGESVREAGDEALDRGVYSQDDGAGAVGDQPKD